MRSKRTSRKELKSELETLRGEVARLTAKAAPEENPAGCKKEEALLPAAPAPKIASCGYPLRSAPQKPKSLKEAKELLMSLRDW